MNDDEISSSAASLEKLKIVMKVADLHDRLVDVTNEVNDCFSIQVIFVRNSKL